MNAFLEALSLLWKGMLAIFIAVIVIYIFIFAMNAIDGKRKANNTKNTET